MKSESSEPQPDIEIKPAMRVVGFGRVFRWSEMGEIPQLWQKAGPWIEAIPNAVNENAYGAMFIPQPGYGDLGYMAGIAVPETYLPNSDQMVVRLPELVMRFSRTTGDWQIGRERSTTPRTRGCRNPGTNRSS